MRPGARLRELRGAAHGLMVEQPGAFNAAVLEFLRDVDTRAAVPTP
jgi:pimeloyl-ACP methyl ester carboxylesterase